jgi:hypothetical protein
MTNNVFMARYPANGEADTNQDNPAIRLFGRRFYKDQTPVEYLAEFLLAFSSAKKENGIGEYQFGIVEENGVVPEYWPKNRIALKFFSFFSMSKLETRHSVHRVEYIAALESVSKNISGSKEEKEETIRLLQSLFGGFVGVAKNRTWVTYSFLPAANTLLASEVGWEHPKALKDSSISDWKGTEKHFGRFRNFMARGGELLFLQLANLFSDPNAVIGSELLTIQEYIHLKPSICDLQLRIEFGLKSMLTESVGEMGGLVNFIEGSLSDYSVHFDSMSNKFGWVPAVSRTEALLFAFELDNICSSSLGGLDKLELLQVLCCMQVLRSLCFQARRVDQSENETSKFVGNYVWIVAASDAKSNSPIRQMAQGSYNKIDAMLYRSIRSSLLKNGEKKIEAKDLKNGDDNTFGLFRKFSKHLGLVIPRTGTGQRFSLDQSLLRFLVAVLIRPGEKIRLTEFYARAFSHYGIALGGEQLTVALNWMGHETDGGSYAVSSSTGWVEEALQQGGFLVELSDAVSMVKNPG